MQCSSFGLGQRLVAWLQAAHPYPIAMVLSLTALIGLASADGGPNFARLAVAVLAMLLSQLAIGWTNDYVDRESDAMHQPWKPVASGAIEPGHLPAAAAAATIAALVLAGFLGWLSLVFCLIGTAAGLAYDLRLKDTPFSWLPYVIAFAALPPFVWSAIDVFRNEFLFLYVVASPLVLAAHIGQTLPDIEADRQAKRYGVVAALGASGAGKLLLLCLIAAPMPALLSALWLEYDLALLVPTLLVYALLLALATTLYRQSRQRAAYRPIALASVLFSAGWLAAV